MVLLLEFNQDAQTLLDWVIDCCYTAPRDIADSCFLALATVFNNRSTNSPTSEPTNQYSYHIIYIATTISLRLGTHTQPFSGATHVSGGATGKAFGLAISRSRVQILLETSLRNNLRQVVYAYVPLSPSSITWYRPKGGDALRLGR